MYCCHSLAFSETVTLHFYLALVKWYTHSFMDMDMAMDMDLAVPTAAWIMQSVQGKGFLDRTSPGGSVRNHYDFESRTSCPFTYVHTCKFQIPRATPLPALASLGGPGAVKAAYVPMRNSKLNILLRMCRTLCDHAFCATFSRGVTCCSGVEHASKY